MATQERLAVLIDADNAQALMIQELLAEVSRYGTATIKRAYGVWEGGRTRCTNWRSNLYSNFGTRQARIRLIPH
jgi:hypothetical protein